MFDSKRLAATAIVALSALGAPARAGEDGGSVIKLISTCTSINDFVDVGQPGPTPGDIYVWVDDLSTPDGSQKVGQVIGRCNLVDPAASSFSCSIVSVLGEGTITSEFILFSVPGVVSVGAITGGSGRYQGAAGEISVELGSPCGPHNITVTLRPARLKI